ncbi:MAG: hypothetical protein J7485_10735 [Sphingobium sp.]|nr:hypothetical protein [Sphingobium sp.]
MLSLSLSGCAEFDSVYHSRPLPKGGRGGFVTVDAKQRSILVLPPNDGTASWRVCAEAAPDVFSAYATSVGARGNKSGGEFSLASNETAASLERSQAINMLRESLYRTCERYASGAINKAQFIVQAARDQRSMIAFLAIEQLTGAVRPKSTLISPGGTAASTMSGEATIKLLNDYQTKLDAAKEKQEAADKAVKAAKADGGICSTDDKKKEDGNAAKCAALDLELANATKDLVKAQENQDNALKLAKDLVSATVAGTSTGTSQQGGGISQSDISQANLATVSWAVTQIVAMSTINEAQMFCLAYFGNDKLEDKILTPCLEILKAKQESENRFIENLKIDNVSDFMKGLLDTRYGNFKESFIQRLKKMPDTDKEFVEKLKKFELAMHSSFLSDSKKCGSKASCITFVGANDPYKANFDETAGAAALKALD